MEVNRRAFIGGALAAAATKTFAGEKVPAYDLKDYKTGALGKIVGELPPGRYDTHVHAYPGTPDPAFYAARLAEAGFRGGVVLSENPDPMDGSPAPDPEKAMDNAIAWASASPTKRTLSTDVATLRGRINVGLASVREAFPSAQILLLTPVHRGYAKFSERNVQPDESYSNGLGLFIDDYVACIAEAGRVHAVTVVDLNSLAGLYPLCPAHARDYFRNEPHPDRADVLHPGTAGHRRMADAIRPVLENLLAR